MSVLFAASVVPMLALVGLAIDFGIWNQTNAVLSLAADTAALNAVKIAGNGQLNGDSQSLYVAEGQTAGKQWFAATAGSYASVLSANSPNVSLTAGTSITATVTYSGTVTSVFGGMLYKIFTYPINGLSTATIATAPFLNVEIMLDNSSSMEIGATNTDMATLQEMTPCGIPSASYSTASGAIYGYNPTTHVFATWPPSGQNFQAFQYSTSSGTYSGGLTVPFPAGSSNGYNFATWTPLSNAGTYTSQIQPLDLCTKLPKQSNGTYPAAGAPCAFACHFDTTVPAGTGNDYFALARSTIGTAKQVTLRFDLVKKATNNVIAAMKTYNLSINNLGVGVFTFSNSLTRVYPASGEAGNDWDAATAAVGAPPNAPNKPDTGIQPDGSSDVADTDFPDSMNALAGQLSKSGDGSTAATPRKVLFIVTDGLQDYYTTPGNTNTRSVAAINPTYCTNFKNMGYSIYVVYTPYEPLMNSFYLNNLVPIVETTGANSLSYNLQACASGPANYISASDGSSLQAALQKFLKQALFSPAKFSI